MWLIIYQFPHIFLTSLRLSNFVNTLVQYRYTIKSIEVEWYIGSSILKQRKLYKQNCLLWYAQGPITTAQWYTPYFWSTYWYNDDTSSI